MVENLIAGYLSTGKRLVIPDLGAFLKKETGEVVFVEYLKKDDGVFTGLISRTLAVPPGEAARHAARLTASIRESLSSKGFYIVPELGTMRRDASGALILATTLTEEPAMGRDNPVEPQPKVAQHTSPGQHAKVGHYTRAETPVDAIKKPERMPRPGGNRPTSATPAPSDGNIKTERVCQPASIHQPPATSASPLYGEKSPETAIPPAKPTRTEAPRRRPPVQAVRPRKKTDMVMIIAVVAALIAIGSMVYGLMVDNDPIMNIQPTSTHPETVQEQFSPEE